MNPSLQSHSRFLPWLELGFIAAAGFGYVVFRKTLAFRAEFIVPIAVVAALYIVFLAGSGRRTPGDFGLRWDNIGRASAWTALLFVGPLLFLLARGYFTMVLPSHFYYTLGLYPLWGILQQLVFQGFVLENFRRLGAGWVSIPLTALFYGFVHWPSPFMLWATGVAGLGFSTLYWFHRNVIPIGVAHGILGACLFYLYLGRDPFARFIG